MPDVDMPHVGELHWLVVPQVILALMTLVLWLQARRTRELADRAAGDAARVARLARFFSPAVAARLAKVAPQEPTSRRQPIAVLFADVRGFTGMAESMTPEELGEFLTEFRSRVTQNVFDRGGTVDKVLGDGVRVVFGAPAGLPVAAADAFACASRMHAAMANWSRMRVQGGSAAVRISIGAHYGDAYVGVLGRGKIPELTAIGDTVNIAERLQRVAADSDGSTVISDALRDAAGFASVAPPWEPMGAVGLTGREQEIVAWRLPAATDPENGATAP
jgi:adenylate cyclase